MPSNVKGYAAILAAAAALAAGFEGLRQSPYLDPRPNDAILTVCYGHTGDDIERRKYSLQECTALLEEDMRTAVDQVNKCHPNLPFGVLVAFSDAVYNIGPKIACNSTASSYLKQENYEKACKELIKWNKSNGITLPGLTRRREAEMKICLDSIKPSQK